MILTHLGYNYDLKDNRFSDISYLFRTPLGSTENRNLREIPSEYNCIKDIIESVTLTDRKYDLIQEETASENTTKQIIKLKSTYHISNPDEVFTKDAMITLDLEILAAKDDTGSKVEIYLSHGDKNEALILKAYDEIMGLEPELDSKVPPILKNIETLRSGKRPDYARLVC